MKAKVTAALMALSAMCVLPATPKSNVLSGQINHDRITALTGNMNWHKSLGQAETTATSQGKMVFWVHMLGTMTGAT